MILIYYKTWIYQCLIIQVKSPSIYMVSRPGLGSDPSFGSGRESGRDKECILVNIHPSLNCTQIFKKLCTRWYLFDHI